MGEGYRANALTLLGHLGAGHRGTGLLSRL